MTSMAISANHTWDGITVFPDKLRILAIKQLITNALPCSSNVVTVQVLGALEGSVANLTFTTVSAVSSTLVGTTFLVITLGFAVL